MAGQVAQGTDLLMRLSALKVGETVTSAANSSLKRRFEESFDDSVTKWLNSKSDIKSACGMGDTASRDAVYQVAMEFFKTGKTPTGLNADSFALYADPGREKAAKAIIERLNHFFKDWKRLYPAINK